MWVTAQTTWWYYACWRPDVGTGARHLVPALKVQTEPVTDIERTVRRANTEDLHAVLELERAAPVGREHRALLTARLQSGEVILIEQAREVLGYAVLHDRAFFGHDFVELLAVSTGDRRSGVGSLLLQRAVEMASTQRVFTSTNQSNTPMICLLDKAGWRFSGALEGIDEGDPELVYFIDAS